MKKIYLILTCAACMAFCSCHSSKDAALNDLRKFRTELAQNGDTYTVKDWEKAADKYQKINQKLMKYQYNNSEMEEIGRIHGQCAQSFTSALANKVTGIGSFLKGLYDSFKGSISGFDFDLNKLFKGAEE